MNQNGESSRGGQIGHGRDHSYRSSLLLFLAASIWGVAFVAQSVGMDYMGPFPYVSLPSSFSAHGMQSEAEEPCLQ